MDDGGDQDLNGSVQGFKSDLNILLIRQENQGPATARNAGVQEAKGDFIVFLDDDCEPQPDWLATLYPKAQRNTISGGKIENKLVHNSFSETSQRLVSFLYSEWKDTPWYFFTSNNFMVHRQTFLQAGGFDENFPTSAGEDREFCARWIHLGNQMEYVPTAIVNHAHDLKLRSFWKMHSKYGGAAYLFGGKIKRLGVDALKPRISFYMHLFGFVLQQKELGFKRAVSISFLIFVSQLATLFGLMKEKFRH